MILKCTKCDKISINAEKRWLDRALKAQVYLVANKPKYDKWEYLARYFKIGALITQLDPELYKLGRD
jgi:hypothetical protein